MTEQERQTLIDYHQRQLAELDPPPTMPTLACDLPAMAKNAQKLARKHNRCVTISMPQIQCWPDRIHVCEWDIHINSSMYQGKTLDDAFRAALAAEREEREEQTVEQIQAVLNTANPVEF